MSVAHYENFPVASFLCPPALRPAVTAIYWFARTADDLADEGDGTPEERLAALAEYRQELRNVARGGDVSPRWRAVFDPLQDTLRRHALPLPLLEALLSAFEQDVTKTRFADRAELLDYCSRSANPIGRLLLHLYGIRDRRSLEQSDAICTSLQLINFWQDLSIDIPRGRIYVPLSDCAREAVDPQQLLDLQHNRATRRLVATEVAWARELMLEGAPLVKRIPGRAGWELRVVIQGGLRILEKIERMQHATLRERPRLTTWDVPVMLWRAWRA